MSLKENDFLIFWINKQTKGPVQLEPIPTFGQKWTLTIII